MSGKAFVYDANKFDMDQRKEIEVGLKEGLDVSLYAQNIYIAMQMQEIRLGLSRRLDVEKFAKPEFDWFQMREIRLGLESGIDVDLYAKKTISYDRMRELRKGLEQGIDLTKYADLSAGIIWQLCIAAKDKMDLTPFIEQNFDAEQLEQIRLAKLSSISLDQYVTPEYMGVAMQEIRIGLEENLDVSIYASLEYNWRQMREIRYGLEGRLDVKQYLNPLFEWTQMRELRRGLKQGLDVSSYRKFIFTDKDMRRIRKDLLDEYKRKNPNAITTEIEDENCTLLISDDMMSGFIRLRKYVKDPYTIDDVKGFLNRRGIVYGINEEVIGNILKDELWNEQIQVAFGIEAQNGADGYYEYFFETEPSLKPMELEDGSVDYRNVNWFEAVKAGDKIAYYHEATEGINGCNIIGMKIDAIKGAEQSVLTGPDIELLEDEHTYIAKTDGKIELKENKITISKLLEVAEVNMPNTGNITFDGSIHVLGDVNPGLSVRATQDIIIDGTVESATVVCGGNLLIKGGVTGKGSSCIQAMGDIFVRYLEAAYVLSEGDLNTNYCLNCNVVCNGLLNLSGKQGMLAGGIIKVLKKINAYDIGNHAGIKTVVKMDYSEKYQAKRINLYNELDQTNSELEVFKNAIEELKKKYPPEVRNTMETYLKLENAVYTEELAIENIKKQILDMEAEIAEAQKQNIVVRGKLYEGVEIEMGRAYYKASYAEDVTILVHKNRIVVTHNNV